MRRGPTIDVEMQKGCPLHRYDVQNWAMQQMRKNRVDDGSYGNQRSECSQGIYLNCFVTDWGCEPFSLWQLEGDGGLSGTYWARDPEQAMARSWLAPIAYRVFQGGGDAKLFFRYSGPNMNENMIIVPGRSWASQDTLGL